MILNEMRRRMIGIDCRIPALTCAFLLSACATGFAQAPDCYQQFSFTNVSPVPPLLPLPIYPVPGSTPTVDNRGIGCINWTVFYESEGFSAVSLTFQSATGASVAGTLGAYSGTTLTGANPLTGTVSAGATFNGYVGWWNIALTATGTGSLRGFVYGYRNGFAVPGTTPPGSGCPGTSAIPCQIISQTPANSTGSWTSGTATNTAVTVSLAGYSNVAVSYFQTGTITGGIISFEVSPDNTNWQAIGMVNVSSVSIQQTTYGLVGGTNAWQMFTGGFMYFRVRLSTGITGGGTANILVAPSVMGTEFAQVVGNTNAAGLQAEVQGVAAEGAAASGNPMRVGGWDGTDIRTLATDTNGYQKMIGPTAAGSAPTTAPVLVAGSDGTDLRTLATDTNGYQKMIGPTAAGSAPTTAPVLVAGSDGTDLRTVKTDTSGDVAIYQIGLGTFSTSQQAVTASAVALATNTSKNVCLKALIGNTINVYVGASGVTTSTGFELTPGQGACWNVANTNLLYVIATTTGASVAWSFTN